MHSPGSVDRDPDVTQYVDGIDCECPRAVDYGMRCDAGSWPPSPKVTIAALTGREHMALRVDDEDASAALSRM